MCFVPRPSRTDDGRGCRSVTPLALSCPRLTCADAPSPAGGATEIRLQHQQDQSETLGSDVLLESVSEPSLPGAASMKSTSHKFHMSSIAKRIETWRDQTHISLQCLMHF